MGRRKGPERVQYSARFPPELLQVLHEIAQLQATDVNGVLNAILQEFVPDYIRRIRAQHNALLSFQNLPDGLAEFRNSRGLGEAIKAWRMSGRTSNRVIEDVLDSVVAVGPDVRVKLVELAKEIDELSCQEHLLDSMKTNPSWVVINYGDVIDVELLRARAGARKSSLVLEWNRLRDHSELSEKTRDQTHREEKA